MNDMQNQGDLSSAIGTELPYLRRYARALTGSQESGDKYALATLEAILEDAEIISTGMPIKEALFKTFNSIWRSSGAQIAGDGDMSPEEARAQKLLSDLTDNTREALLLHSIERFTLSQIAQIMDIDEDEAAELLDIARKEMQQNIHGRIMIIEDEAIIAMDISGIVEQMGHDVTGIARTRDAAVELARKQPPDMILADIQLADKSSGIDAVNHIFAEMGEIPVVFITAFPERLLTGERPEPAFLITKPYTEDQVQSAVSQAMFFASSENIEG
ncbi:response regulator [uncultured Roseovarius sp.]|uniref:response regulator n=1 Tax=uncultured Roseovarius sp. TaxID=293344 RepID=UPI0026251E5E|nr:response regulator [uncultured Roseovarius sp.]